jgi:mono/diheme cytochrome c family protein
MSVRGEPKARRATRVLGGFVVLAALSWLTATSLGGPSLVPPAPPNQGTAVYDRYCAACHGATGRGDGASGAALAIKPSNLADGRVMNPLPDEFLIAIIRDGGPAVGLSPLMPGWRAHLGEEQITHVIGYLRALADPPFRRDLVVPGPMYPPEAPVQPILFSHLIHAGSFGIPCQYCHAEARRSQHAGLPSVERCMGCHKIVGASGNPEIAKIHDHWNRKAAIPWVRVFKVQEFVYFSHKPHVRAGVACQDCHGPVQGMMRVGGERGTNLLIDLKNLLGMSPPPPRLTMGWCVECHKEKNRVAGTKAPLDCVTCHH